MIVNLEPDERSSCSYDNYIPISIDFFYSFRESGGEIPEAVDFVKVTRSLEVSS